MLTGVCVTVEARLSAVRVHVRIVLLTFTHWRPHPALLLWGLHVATVCSWQ